MTGNDCRRPQTCRPHSGNHPGPAWLRKADGGSGTILGICLVAVAAFALLLLVLVTNLLICQAQARTGADASALAAASALDEGDPAPCVKAATVALANRGRLASCRVEDADVVAEVEVATSVPVITYVSRQARAGPQDCD